MLPARLIVVVALTASLLSAAVAQADPPWSAPARIAAGISVFWQPSLAFSGDGHALASLDGRGEGALTRILFAEPGASAFKEVGRALLVAGPAPVGQRGVAYLRAPPPPGGPSAISRVKVTRLGVSLGQVPGSLGRLRPLARIPGSPLDLEADIAADPRGNVAAAWLEPRGRRFVVRVALRRPGGAFGRPSTLVEAAGINEIVLAYGAGGDLVVAVERSDPEAGEARSDIAARVKRPGAPFGPVQSLGRSRGVSSIAVAAAPKGRAVVAWGTQDGGEEAEKPWTVYAAMLRSGAPRFSRAQLLDPGRVARPVADVSAAIGRDGAATVAWSGVTRKKLPYPVRVATASPAGRFGATTQLAPNGVSLGVVIAPDGTTTALWGALTDPEGSTLDGIFASRRAAGSARFAAPEGVAPRQPTSHHGAIALDPRTGRPAALWIGAPRLPFGELLQDDTPVEPLYSTRGD